MMEGLFYTPNSGVSYEKNKWSVFASRVFRGLE